MRILRWIGSLVAVLLLSIIIGVYIFLRSTLPEYDGEIIADGVTGEVEIIRDTFGMPHIYAATDQDAAFALGYCTAQDRLFQMELIRRSVRGRLAEVLGKDFVDVDRLFRIITAGKSLEQMFAGVSPEAARLMEAYASGVNYYLAHHDGNLPFEFSLLGFGPEPWRAADEMACLYYMAWSLNFSFSSDLIRSAIINKVGEDLAADIYPEYPVDAPTILPPEAIGATHYDLMETIARAREMTGVPFVGASNSWVISGSKSETGLPILANDMHLGLIIPSVWCEAHLVTPDLNVSGVVLPGVPVVVAGANQHVAWGFTNVMVDDADFYIEKLNPVDSTQYQFMEQWESMVIREDTIKVRGAEPVPIKIRLTRHGVIVDDIIKVDSLPQRPIAMRWTITDFGREADALYKVNRAENIDDVEAAAALHKCPGQNWVYADDQGNVGFWAAAGIPIRNGFDGGRLLPGWDGQHEWAGYVPTDQQPHLRNPEQGWIATANNKPVGNDYPYRISSCYVPPDRIIRIARLLTSQEKFGIDDVKRMQADQYLVMAEKWMPKIATALSTAELNEKEREAFATLKQWDFDAPADRPAPAVFHVMVQEFFDAVFKERLGDSLYQYWLGNSFVAHNAANHLIEQDNSPWFDNPATPITETRDTVLVRCFKSAVARLIDLFGDNIAKWEWGRLHSMTFFHPVGRRIPLLRRMMNVGPYPMGGGSNSVNPGLYRLAEPFAVLAGASQRHIFDLSNMENSLRIIPTGISGNFMSDHYDDQAPLWLRVDYRPFHLKREDVEREAKYRLKMKPPASAVGASKP